MVHAHWSGLLLLLVLSVAQQPAHGDVSSWSSAWSQAFPSARDDSVSLGSSTGQEIPDFVIPPSSPELSELAQYSELTPYNKVVSTETSAASSAVVDCGQFSCGEARECYTTACKDGKMQTEGDFEGCKALQASPPRKCDVCFPSSPCAGAEYKPGSTPAPQEAGKMCPEVCPAYCPAGLTDEHYYHKQNPCCHKQCLKKDRAMLDQNPVVNCGDIKANWGTMNKCMRESGCTGKVFKSLAFFTTTCLTNVSALCGADLLEMAGYVGQDIAQLCPGLVMGKPMETCVTKNFRERKFSKVSTEYMICLANGPESYMHGITGVTLGADGAGSDVHMKPVPPPSKNVCGSEGGTRICMCETGGQGVQRCREDGKWDKCPCVHKPTLQPTSAKPVCGVVGSTQACKCLGSQDGVLNGVQSCAASGDWQMCQCNVPTVKPSIPSCGVSGATQACFCVGFHDPGMQTCAANGDWSACKCKKPNKCGAVGRTQECFCEGTTVPGIQQCGSSGGWAACKCQAKTTCGIQGSTQACKCPSGIAGVQDCEEGGDWGICQCIALTTPPVSKYPPGWQDMIDKAVANAVKSAVAKLGQRRHGRRHSHRRRERNGDHVVGNTYIVSPGQGGQPQIIQTPAGAAPPAPILPVPQAPCPGPCPNNMLHVRVIHHNLSAKSSTSSHASVTPTFSPSASPTGFPTLLPTAQLTEALQLGQDKNCKFAVVQGGVILGVMDSAQPCKH